MNTASFRFIIIIADIQEKYPNLYPYKGSWILCWTTRNLRTKTPSGK